MSGLLDLLIPAAAAQEFDALSQPTFGEITVPGGNGLNASIFIKSDKTSLEVGSEFKVTVEINTQNIAVNSLSISLNFDPQFFSVVDVDSVTAGTQIAALDSIFTVKNPSSDNIVDNTLGIITFKASTSSTSTSFPLENKAVAEITFQAQNIGNSPIVVAQGVNGSSLKRTNGTTLPYTTNEISIEVKTIQAENDFVCGDSICEESKGESINNCTIDCQVPIPGDGTGTTGTGTTGTNTIPNTSITDSLGSTVAFFGGLLLILTGILLSSGKGRKNKDDWYE